MSEWTQTKFNLTDFPSFYNILAGLVFITYSHSPYIVPYHLS